MINKTASLFSAIALYWLPPPKWTVSQWADSTRKIPSESGPEPGQWRTSRAEYQREILDCVSDPLIERVVIKSSAQVGKTELILNSLGYYMDYDACPILVLQPTVDMAEAFSKERFGPMLRETTSIGAKVLNDKSRKKEDTILYKSFVGGYVAIAGANAPTKLASRPVRVVMADEVDRYPKSAGTEGDPLLLAIKRTNNFWNKKIIVVSTPTIKGESRIDSEFELTDKRFYNIPCARCGTLHVLKWENVIWHRDSPAKGDYNNTVFRCPHCDGYYTDAEKNAAVKKGVWIATAPFTGKAGFHLWEAYSPWKKIAKVVEEFLEAKDDPAKLQVWVNTSQGECFEGSGETIDENTLMQRMEPYAAEVPSRASILTCGVDTQPDRLEAEVVGWGPGEESWSIDHRVFYGDPDIKEGDAGSPWTDLNDYLRKSWQHESGAQMQIGYTMVDSGGHNTQAVYNFCKTRKLNRVFAIKGAAGPDRPIVGPPNRKRSGKIKRKVDLYIIGVDAAKASVYNAFKIEEPGPQYCHFPNGREPEYFRQLTAEKLVTKHVKGYAKREWVKSAGRRNEALDCRVYALAALVMAGPQDWSKSALRLKMKGGKHKPAVKPPEPQAEEKKADTPKEPAPQAKPPQPPENAPRKFKHVPPSRRRARNNFVSSWR